MEKTVEDVEAALARVVERYGANTLYQNRDPAFQVTGRCRYINEAGQPMCIVGVVLVEEWGFDPKRILSVEDVPYEDREAMMGEGCINNVDSMPRSPHFRKAVPMTYEASVLLTEVQNRQDSGYTWGEAVRSARRNPDSA